MPTYTVTATNFELSNLQKSDIAAAITKAHADNTGAPAYFAQVHFRTTPPGNHFIGGKPNTERYIFVLGQIRAGRTVEAKRAAIEEIVEKCADIAGLSPQDVWAYIQDIPADQMAEFGRILPAPGEEAAWRDGLSDEKRAQFERAGISF